MKSTWWVALAAVWAGCLGKSGDAGGETHWQKAWLMGCVASAECGAGLECIGYLCTIPCEDDARCDVFGAGTCAPHAGQQVCTMPERGACDTSLACNDDRDGWFCLGEGDGCRRSISVCSEGQWRPGELDTCRQVVSVSAAESQFEVGYGREAVALDLLFVVDHSTSMASEIVRVADAVPGFLSALDADGLTDVRLAAISVDADCESESSGTAAGGRFNETATTSWPVSLGAYAFPAACSEDNTEESADCAAIACAEHGDCMGAAMWSCDSTVQQLAECRVNPNGSLNTFCRRRCTTDLQCQELLGDSRAICATRGQEFYGCVIAPATEDCPSPVGPVLSGAALASSHCVMTPQLSSGAPCFRYEQGLEASRKALDPSGPNAAQANAFLRPGAALAVVYLSDEDDCSAVEMLPEASFDTCAFLADTDHGGPLIPVSEYEAFLRGLKPGGQVHVAAIVGASTKTDPAEIAADEAAYIESKSSPQNCHRATTICQSAETQADLGRRYLDLVDAFGIDGHRENICVPESLDAMFARTGEAIRRSVRRVCVPLTSWDGVEVARVRAGQESPLPLGTGYLRIEGVSECATGLAITTVDAPQPGDRLVVRW